MSFFQSILQLPIALIGKVFGGQVAKAVDGYSARRTAEKGLRPVIEIGSLSALIFSILKGMGVEIDEATITAIFTGATSLWGAIQAIRNWAKNRRKGQPVEVETKVEAPAQQ